MASTYVGARLDPSVAERAAYYIERAGSTNTEVIRAVYERIAQTGRLPLEDAGGEGGRDTMATYDALRRSTVFKPEFASLTDEDVERMLVERDS